MRHPPPTIPSAIVTRPVPEDDRAVTGGLDLQPRAGLPFHAITDGLGDDDLGCDQQWAWSVDPATPLFVDVTIEIYDGCPSDVEVDKAYWIGNLKRFCPWSAKVQTVVK